MGTTERRQTAGDAVGAGIVIAGVAGATALAGWIWRKVVGTRPQGSYPDVIDGHPGDPRAAPEHWHKPSGQDAMFKRLPGSFEGGKDR